MPDIDTIEVRAFRSAVEYGGMVDYFLNADDAFLRGMGVDPLRLPSREKWMTHLLKDHEQPDAGKDRLYLAWIHDGALIGHSSVNKIKIGEDAFFHLHMWRSDLRKAGLGLQFCRKSVALHFDRLRLKRLWSEPYAENPAPNRTLPKLGFEFIRRYRTVPGETAFEQDVNLYRLDRPDSM